jgi:hypothetical protein
MMQAPEQYTQYKRRTKALLSAPGCDGNSVANNVVGGPGRGHAGPTRPPWGPGGTPVGEDAVSTLQKFLNSILYMPRFRSTLIRAHHC